MTPEEPKTVRIGPAYAVGGAYALKPPLSSTSLASNRPKCYLRNESGREDRRIAIQPPHKEWIGAHSATQTDTHPSGSQRGSKERNELAGCGLERWEEESPRGVHRAIIVSPVGDAGEGIIILGCRLRDYRESCCSFERGTKKKSVQ